MRKSFILFAVLAMLSFAAQRVDAQPRAVDLGLSVKWASCNVGASSPSDYGDFYAWGETETKSDISWETYKWCSGNYDYLTKYNGGAEFGKVDNKTRLDYSDDVARKKWGGKWRMPTDEEWTELIEQCTWTWTTLNGKKGFKVTSKKNANSIFLPATNDRNDWGTYWSSSLDTDDPRTAWCVDFYSGGPHLGTGNRFADYSVRPVCE